MDQQAHEILAKYSKVIRDRDEQIEMADDEGRLQEIERLYAPPLNQLARKLADHLLGK